MTTSTGDHDQLLAIAFVPVLQVVLHSVELQFTAIAISISVVEHGCCRPRLPGHLDVGMGDVIATMASNRLSFVEIWHGLMDTAISATSAMLFSVCSWTGENQFRFSTSPTSSQIFVVSKQTAGRIVGAVMKGLIAVGLIAVSLTLSTTSAFAGRVANTAIGTLAGLVVFGPVGAVAGAAVGYTAGHGIARSWGLSRPDHAPSRHIQRRTQGVGSSVPVPRNKPAASERGV